MAGQSASFNDQEHGAKTLSEKILCMIENLRPLEASSAKYCCIYKASDSMRKWNEEGYTPQVISIGPFHRNNPKLQTMESLKHRYLKSFKERAPTMNLEDLVIAIKDGEESVRGCYSETITLGSDDFVTMILFDATFIIEFFYKNMADNWTTEYDTAILKPWLRNRMKMDLILLENQLPFFIIDKIYDIAFPSLSKGHPFIELTFKQFENYNVQKFNHYSDEHRRVPVSILHFTDLVRFFFLPPPGRRPKRNSKWMKLEMQSATHLARVGLKFKMSNNPSPLELKLYADRGELEIPGFQLDDTTEIYARNLVAFEQCHYPEHAYITDYYTLLSFLLKTDKDLDLLAREQIIANSLGGDGATSLINKLSIEKSFYIQTNLYYVQMAQELKIFYEARVTKYLVKMMVILKHEYFRTPWRGAATIGGILLLVLTVIQTVCALISVKN